MKEQQLETPSQPQQQNLLADLNNLKSAFIQDPHLTPARLTQLEARVSMVFPGFSVESITFTLFMTNCLVWSVLNLVQKFWDKDWDCIQVMFQAKYQPVITYEFQFWRLFLSSFSFNSWKMFVFNNFALNMLGYSIERESTKRFLIGFYLSIAIGNMASCLLQPSDFIWVGCSSGTIGLLPFELERYYRHRQFPELRKRLIFLIVNFTLNLAVNIESIVGHGNVDWISHLGGLFTGILLIMIMSDYSALPECVSSKQYVYKRLAGFMLVGSTIVMVIMLFIGLRVRGIGRELYKNGAPCSE